MYRLTLYYLLGLLGTAFLLSYFQMLSYNPADIILDTAIAVIFSYIANYLCAKAFGAATNIESVFITALILVLIIPVKFPLNLVFLAAASVFAMASKYLVTIEKRHIFNPVAAGVAAIALLSPEYSAIWWIGTPVMFLPVLIGGLLLVRKIKREILVVNFLIAYIVLISIASFLHTGSAASILTTLRASFLQSALLFFVFTMLTEPLTSPGTEKLQAYYGYLVAIFYATPQLRFFGIAFTPELALIFGNIFSYIVNPKYRLELSLQKKDQLSPDTLAFTFEHVDKFSFIPGQYLEWTLTHKKTDSRGNRRYFSIASSSTEKEIMVVVKFYNPSSTYKSALFNLQSGEKVIAAHLAGDFILPKDLNKPIIFIAGGVGIAPFRSMIKYIVDSGLFCDIILLYINRREEDIAFNDVFSQALNNGVKTAHILTDKENLPQGWQGLVGHLDVPMLAQVTPDYKKSTIYISGPQLMVQSIEKTLKSAGVKNKNIKVDFFPGYAETQ